MSTEGLTSNRREGLDKIFSPKSVAVVGTNRVQGTVPYDIFYNILSSGFKGIVYPVSPREASVAGVRAYKYVIDIPDPVDMAVIVFASSVCHLALEQCGKKGIKSVVIISAGFREVGEAGLKRQARLDEIAKKYGMSIIGPNCLGVINTDATVGFNASFARKMPSAGNIGFLSQSGALCTAVLDYTRAKNIGFSKFVSFGNKMDVSEVDLLHYLAEDEQTKVILLYLEEVSNGRALLEAAHKIIAETGKPILAIKSGRTQEGAKAAASHTGSLAGSDRVCDAIFRQAGIIRANTIEEMFNFAVALAYQPMPAGDRIAIITNAGGPGVMATDAAVKYGLNLAQFSEETTQVFKKTLPATANIKNPVDVIGDARADRYKAAVGASLADENVDGVGVILTPQSMTDIDAIAEVVCESSHGSGKPVYASFMGESDVASGIDRLQRNHVPHYPLPETMCSAFASAHRFKTWLQIDRPALNPLSDDDPDSARNILDEAVKAGKSYLPEYEASMVLGTYGFPLIESILAASADEAADRAEKIGFPVVLKIESPDVVHKFDVGGVVLNLETPEAVRTAYNTIIENVQRFKADAKINGVTVEKMITGGEEVILGVQRDPVFGPVVIFGLGGIFVEILKDVTFRAAPLDEYAVGTMIREIRSYPMLAGARGRTNRDVPALENCIRRLSHLATDCPQIASLDINPLIVLDEGKGCYVADARIML